MLVITKGCADLCFLDGRTYEPLFARRVSRYHDCKWHPHDPDKMICVRRTGVDLWAPRTNAWTAVFRPAGYSQLEFGPYKGNPSHDGNMIALRARNAQQELVAFAYHIGIKHKFPDIPLSKPTGANLYVTISASGRYIFVSQLTADGKEPAYVFTVDGALVQHWPEHHRPGHGDMAIDADGTDVYVGVSKSPPDEFHVIKRRLKDGKVTSLIPYGDANHVSARNIRWPGWVFRRRATGCGRGFRAPSGRCRERGHHERSDACRRAFEMSGRTAVARPAHPGFSAEGPSGASRVLVVGADDHHLRVPFFSRCARGASTSPRLERAIPPPS